MTNPVVAVFRPDDDRMARATERLESLGVEPVADPMLAVEPTDETPRTDADYAVLTSKTGVELADERGWHPGDATVCAIGSSTAATLEAHGYPVDVVPDEYSSGGLVARLHEEADGTRVEIARSDHGSDVLLDGLEAAGAYVHETVLYRLTIPEGAGRSVERAADGTLDGALFTSSLTVENFLAVAADRGLRGDALGGLNDAVVGVIGAPTKETAESVGVDVDVVPEEAEFGVLAETTVARLD